MAGSGAEPSDLVQGILPRDVTGTTTEQRERRTIVGAPKLGRPYQGSSGFRVGKPPGTQHVVVQGCVFRGRRSWTACSDGRRRPRLVFMRENRHARSR